MKRFVLGLSVLFAAMTVNAQTPQTPPPQPTKPAAPAARYSDEGTSSNGSSAQNRVGKSFTITGQPIGITTTALLISGVNLGFSLAPNTLIWVDLLGNLNDNFESDYKTKVFSLGVSLKQFLGNSFYLKGGLEHRTVSRDYDSFFSGSFDEQWGYKGSSTGVSFGLGNQWQIGHFTIGCDWIGVILPISHTRKDEYVSVAQSGSSADLQEDSDEALKDTRVNLLHFYLGASF
ncbi:MAG: hypothetical protein EOP05_02980 [Proteobacteria bacterium]|nr:MAG: hypothetical protein EOP05_02980 [Pseudomonadota bacterium]